jgi:hypothetical protein
MHNLTRLFILSWTTGGFFYGVPDLVNLRYAMAGDKVCCAG